VDAFIAALDAANNEILPQIRSNFEKAGRSRSGLADIGIARAMSDNFAKLYGQERANMMGASQAATDATRAKSDAIGRAQDNQVRSMLFAPQMADLDYQNIAKLAEVGALREGKTQEELGEDIARWDYSQNAKNNQLIQFMNLLNGNFGSQSTSTTSADTGDAFGLKNIMGGVGGLLSAEALKINPLLAFMGGFGF
jgi:hypothetical protein